MRRDYYQNPKNLNQCLYRIEIIQCEYYINSFLQLGREINVNKLKITRKKTEKKLTY